MLGVIKRGTVLIFIPLLMLSADVMSKLTCANQRFGAIIIQHLDELSPYCLGTFHGIIKKNMPGKLFFFQSSASSSVLYVRTLYPGASQYIAN
jgi:hypothetical protein